MAFFGAYAADQSQLRPALLEACRGGLDEAHVNGMHAAADEGEWRGLPDWRRCPLPAGAAIDLARLRQLLEEGAFPDCSDAFGRTPVFYACLHGDIDALHLLCRAGASPAHRPHDRAYLPPIFWALYFEQPAMVALLWRFGAVPFTEGGAGAAGRPCIGEGLHTLESFRAAFCSRACEDVCAFVHREWVRTDGALCLAPSSPVFT
eukprot:5403365-Prymnesium_polylepis.1